MDVQSECWDAEKRPWILVEIEILTNGARPGPPWPPASPPPVARWRPAMGRWRPAMGRWRPAMGRWRAGAWRPVTGGGLAAGDGRLRSGWRRAIDRLRRGGRFINLAHSCGVVQSINNRFNFRIFKLMYLLIWTFSPKRISPKEFDSNWIQFGFSFWVRVFSINFQPISNQFNPFFDHFPTIFHPTIVHFLGQFSANFQPIFSQFSVNFQSIFSQFRTRFESM